MTKNPSGGSKDNECCCPNDAPVHLEKVSPYSGEDQNNPLRRKLRDKNR